VVATVATSGVVPPAGDDRGVGALQLVPHLVAGVPRVDVQHDQVLGDAAPDQRGGVVVPPAHDQRLVAARILHAVWGVGRFGVFVDREHLVPVVGELEGGTDEAHRLPFLLPWGGTMGTLILPSTMRASTASPLWNVPLRAIPPRRFCDMIEANSLCCFSSGHSRT
jgi:hypothetical protein